MTRLFLIWFSLSLTFSPLVSRSAQPWISENGRETDFALAHGATIAPLVYSSDDYKVVALAAADLARDIEAVTGVRASLGTTIPGQADDLVVVGTQGHSAAIDSLVAAGKLDLTQIHGAWESFLIATVENPYPKVKRALVIAGSDRRGTAFGIYELSQAIGVSPWHWWSDVPPPKKTGLFVSAGTLRFGPPSVRYRGIFINDEDWGLQPWAARTFEPEQGNIGPKTYQKVFELLLRLKANTLWPAMHACTTPFNGISENARLADDYAIVMGSSHAEPMLRNNVGEWKGPHEGYNYVTNRDGVLSYWEERVKKNGRFENLYTLGMRGIHDSSMQGTKTDPERIQVLEQVFRDQRALLEANVNPKLEKIPQLFCAYKEVLSLYRQGLMVPDDVTIVWPDDNFGYIRNFATAEEQSKRTGGFGVYYHISYLGAPLSYLWLETTPPSLIWEEMSKAYDHGARQVWIVNVGDIKPAEIGTEVFLSMAWDMRPWQHSGEVARFLENWAAREFGPGTQHEIASLMARYYALNYQRKPEHLQWWLPREKIRRSDLTEEEINERLEQFSQLVARVDGIRAKLKPEQHDAFFELIAYPVHGSALANRRMLATELYDLSQERGDIAAARKWAEQALSADEQLRAETRKFNEDIADGKWRGIMTLEPADTQWASMRIAPPRLPPKSQNLSLPAPKKEEAPALSSLSEKSSAKAEIDFVVASREAESFDGNLDRESRWEIIPGLGRTGDSVAVFPTTHPALSTQAAATQAPRLDYRITFPESGTYTVTVFLIPTHPIRSDAPLQFYLGCDDEVPQLVTALAKDGSHEWALGVLNATTLATASLTVPRPGSHTLRIYGSDTGVVLDKLIVHRGPLPLSYFGPPSQ